MLKNVEIEIEIENFKRSRRRNWRVEPTLETKLKIFSHLFLYYLVYLILKKNDNFLSNLLHSSVREIPGETMRGGC